MSQISLVLPFGLPPPELSADLARALKAPALATLLAKSASHLCIAGDQSSRTLPHEQWLAGALGLTEPAFGQGSFLVHPGHIEIGRSHLTLTDLRRLQLSDAHSRALHAAAAPMFEELGLALSYGDASTWRLDAPAWEGLECASPDAAAGLDIADWMPRGDAAIKFRKLQNEIQMLWFEHPANVEREQRGLQAVNAFWPWANGKAAQAGNDRPVFTSNCPPWMTALCRGETDFASLLASAREPVAVICGELAAAAIANDWGGWLATLEQLEQQWFAPALAALREGKIKRLRLVRGNREHLTDTVITPGSLRKFWRAPSLARLAT
jgi:hypothetical protein